MDKVTCPYCEEENNVNHDDWANYQEDEQTEVECINCDKVFAICTSVIYHHEWEKLDCRNWWEHDWENVAWSPREYFHSMQRCSYCCDERIQDPEGREKLLKEMCKWFLTL